MRGLFEWSYLHSNFDKGEYHDALSEINKSLADKSWTRRYFWQWKQRIVCSF